MWGDDENTAPNMAKVPLRRLLSRLTALALTASAAPPALAKAPTELADLEDDREIDQEHLDRGDAAAALGRGLALALGELRPLEATQVAATWSLSRDPLRRLALGIALEWTFPLVGDVLVIDHLSRDPDPQIRMSAARAAWIRRAAQPGAPWSELFSRLADDPDPQVRAVAAAARA